MDRLTTVILPTRERAEQAARCVERLVHVSRRYPLEILVVTDGDEETRRACAGLPATRVLFSESPMRAIACWNWGAHEAHGEILMLGADDLWWGHGWIGEMLDRMADFPNGEGMVGLNDLHQNGHVHATHWAVSKRFALEALGGVLVTPHYQHFYCDNEANARAKRAGRYTWAEWAIVEHRHPAAGKAAMDAGYVRRQALMGVDRAIFTHRVKAGFPDDFEPVITL